MSEAAVLNAKEAIAKHVHWKIVLQFAITVEEQLAPEQISAIRRHHECAIGRWLDSPANLKFREHPAYRTVVARHIDFHREMVTISEMIFERRFAEARICMRVDSHFGRAAGALALAITALDQVSKIAVPV